MATMGADQLGKMAQAGISGIQSGMDFAQRRQQLEFQREQFEFQKEQVNEARDMQKKNIALNVVSGMYEATNNEYSGKVRAKIVEQTLNKLNMMGINVQDSAFIAALGDEEQSSKIATVMGMFENAVNSGNSPFAKEMQADLMEMMGSENALKYVNDIYNKRHDIEKNIMQITAQQEAAEQKRRDALEKEGREWQRTRGRQVETDIDSFRKEVQKVDSEYRNVQPKIRAVDNIERKVRARGGAGKITEVEAMALVNAVQRLLDDSVVREGEYARFQTGVGGLERLAFEADKLLSGKQIPDKIVGEIFDVMDDLKESFEVEKARRLEATLQNLQSRGLQAEAKNVFGANLDTIRRGKFLQAKHMIMDERGGTPLSKEEEAKLKKAYGVK